MKKVSFLAMGLFSITTFAQTGRVGINTEKPRATLEIKAVVSGNAQGVLFPHIDESEKSKWKKSDTEGLVAGTLVWNTTKKCLDYFDGTNWQCTDGTKKNIHPTPWEPPVYRGTAKWNGNISFTKNNCGDGYVGRKITYNMEVSGNATSTISQEDADEKALQDAKNNYDIEGQKYANQNATCTIDLGDLEGFCAGHNKQGQDIMNYGDYNKSILWSKCDDVIWNGYFYLKKPDGTSDNWNFYRITRGVWEKYSR